MRLTGLTWGNLSSQLSTLEEAGYVHIQKQFLEKKSHTMIELTDKGRRSFREYKPGLIDVLSELPD